ncbi:MAG: GNAT family N-acetyltransferase [Chloroflexi bacterium]|nr:GNAT family N-acetyltransferase [Chloroflexota bacterium]
MLKLQGKDIYLATLERADCRKIWVDFEYDFDNPSEPLNIGHSIEKADGWFDDIQKAQGKQNVRLGIFLNGGTVIGDVALQDIDKENRCCSVGMGIAKLENRSRGYGKQAIKLMLQYGFYHLGLERITANTLETNIGGRKSLEQSGFVLEGTERKAVYLNGEKLNRLNYAILKEEYIPAGK